ncbi:Alpha/Beta hydrolase protein [Aspergillus pseudoustus]|uniref:Alpha/Beta hydrolase protein n=1 Tax=Aspergillus pseudoustus TaxID=1810923 RepID=A0ABR4J6M2_9EURO
MTAFQSIIFALLLPLALAGRPLCFDFNLPVQVTVPITKFSVSPFHNNSESTSLLVNSVARTANVQNLVAGEANINRAYNINFRYCEPGRGVLRNGIVQVLTHGLGFDKSYWDFEGYSYIASATTAGYSTLSYDRLGVGRSELADPYLDVQAATQVAILEQASELLKGGKLSSKIPIPKKLVHVGHSFGSLITNSLAATSPNVSDAIVLTGFGHDFSWSSYFQLCYGFELARLNKPLRFHNYDSGYLTWGNEFDNQCAAFKYPYFESAVLHQAELNKAPFTIAELLSFGVTSLASPEFAGPVLIINGAQDLSFCGGDCYGVLDAADSPSAAVFPKASSLAAYIHPNAGHALNLHYNATAAYEVILSFLGDHGL